jgi:hypothetical protein
VWQDRPHTPASEQEQRGGGNRRTGDEDALAHATIVGPSPFPTPAAEGPGYDAVEVPPAP